MSSNKQRLGEIFSAQMKRTSAAAVPTTMELGKINANLSLTTDSLPVPIPKGDYMVNLMLASSTYRTSIETHTHDGGSHGHSGGDHSHSGGSHTHNGGDHDHRLPEDFRLLEPGDRVLVAWCGNEPVVVAIVVSS